MPNLVELDSAISELASGPKPLDRLDLPCRHRPSLPRWSAAHNQQCFQERIGRVNRVTSRRASPRPKLTACDSGLIHVRSVLTRFLRPIEFLTRCARVSDPARRLTGGLPRATACATSGRPPVAPTAGSGDPRRARDLRSHPRRGRETRAERWWKKSDHKRQSLYSAFGIRISLVISH